MSIWQKLPRFANSIAIKYEGPQAAVRKNHTDQGPEMGHLVRTVWTHKRQSASMNDKGKVLAKGCPDGGMDTSKSCEVRGTKGWGVKGGCPTVL